MSCQLSTDLLSATGRLIATHSVQNTFRRSLISMPSSGVGKRALIASGMSFMCKPSGVSILRPE